MNKNKFYILTIPFFFIILSFNFKDSTDCSKIKNGRFYYYTQTSSDRVEIERFDSIQVETITKNGRVLKNKIVWMDDCKFNMYVNAYSDSKLSIIDSILSVTPVAVEILTVNSQYYVCKYKISILNNNIEGTDTMYFKK